MLKLLKGLWMVAGIILGVIAFAYNMLILSDIPVSFETDEAMTSQFLFFLATAMIGTGVIMMNNQKLLGGLFIFISFGFVLQLQVLGVLIDGESAAVPMLQLAPLLHTGLLLLLNAASMLQSWVSHRL
ncbi:hypothetical protein EQV77_08910 [Halobacillus fulvus]|nr:hypothetical protein EQV77_08910 [Halobacillus fulvus]